MRRSIHQSDLVNALRRRGTSQETQVNVERSENITFLYLLKVHICQRRFQIRLLLHQAF